PPDQDVAGGTGGRARRSGAVPPDDSEQGRGDGDPARVADLPVAGEYLHAPLCAGLEGGRPPTPSRGADRQLRGRLRDLLPWHRRRGDDGHAGDDVQAEIDGQRGQDADVPRAGGDVRLPGSYLRPELSPADGGVLSRGQTVGEEDPAALPRDQ